MMAASSDSAASNARREKLEKEMEQMKKEIKKHEVAEEMKDEMIIQMGIKWKKAEEERMEAEREVADRDQLIKKLQKMLGQQSSQSTASPNWRQTLEDDEEESFAVAHQFDSGLRVGISTTEEKQLEMKEADYRIQALQRIAKVVSLNKDILHQSINHWRAVAVRLLDSVVLIKEQVWAGGETKEVNEVVERMEEAEDALLAMVDAMANHDVFLLSS